MPDPRGSDRGPGGMIAEMANRLAVRNFPRVAGVPGWTNVNIGHSMITAGLSLGFDDPIKEIVEVKDRCLS